jgi:Tol biopolymer transport system component
VAAAFIHGHGVITMRPLTVIAVLVVVVGCGHIAAPSAAPSVESASATSSETSRPTVAPLGGGEIIVFERLIAGTEQRELYAVRPDGGDPWLVRSAGEYPHWSPDGSQLAFLACLNPPDCTTAMALLDRATGEVRGHVMPDPDLFTSCAVWTPSGTELACEGNSESDPTRNGVYTLRASDGQGLTRITSNPGAGDSPLAFSPDGSRLLISRLDPGRDEPANQALFVTSVSGGQPDRITPWGLSDDYASWSPDGRTIVFGTDGALYRVSPEGEGLAEITLQLADGSSPENAFDVSFSPDGTRIVFSVGGPAPGIYTARIDGSDVQRLTASPTEDHHANWAAASGSQ